MVGGCFSFHELEKALIYSGTLLSEGLRLKFRWHINLIYPDTIVQ